jgi:hypothetical protein
LRKDELTTAENTKAGLAAGECGNGYRTSGNGYRRGDETGKAYPRALGRSLYDPIAPLSLARNAVLAGLQLGDRMRSLAESQSQGNLKSESGGCAAAAGLVVGVAPPPTDIT